MTTSNRRPDLSSQPHNTTIEYSLKAAPDAVYRAWTERFDLWFAAPGSVLMTPEVDVPFFFETDYQGRRAPHYGRFLHLEPARRVELVWVTSGTDGFETVVSVELEAENEGTHLRLTHAGFPNKELRDRHEQAWPQVLAQFDERVASQR